MNMYAKYANVTSVADLRARLSTHLGIVKAGGEVLVTDRGTPVARLVPVEEEMAGDARIQELARAGLVHEPRVALDSGFFREPRAQDPCSRGLEVLLEERAEGP